MQSPRLIQLIALVLAAGLFFASSRFAPSINEGRRALNMLGSDTPEESAPPEFAFAIQAFGAFRSLLTNIAFIRASTYKEQGRYYDAMQLANWICKLQPRFPSVWEFQAWNMAWNISVTTYTPEERWNWVYNGVKLLRDEGLKANPRAVNLYKQLAWIFVNKMSEPVDDFHLDYKKYWAWRMHLVLGPPPDPLARYQPDKPIEKFGGDMGRGALAEAARAEAERRGDAELIKAATQNTRAVGEGDTGPMPYDVVKKAAYDRIKEIDDAPRTLANLYTKAPETREMVAALHEIGVNVSDDKLTEDNYWREEGLAFRFFRRYRRLVDPLALLGRISTSATDEADAANLARMDQILGVRAGNPAGQLFVKFLQRKVLSEVYKLDPGHMAECMQWFGPMDWRIVDAHSLYWVSRAIIEGKETLQSFRNDKTNTSRLIFFSLRNLFLRNHLVFEPYPPAVSRSYFNSTPDMNFIEPMHEAFLTYGPQIDPDENKIGAGETYKVGHINFLTEAIRNLYLSNRLREARKYYDYLRDTYNKRADGSPNPDYLIPLEDFVFKGFYEVIDSPRETQLAIGALLQAAFGELAGGDIIRYDNLSEWAFKLHSKFMEERSDPAMQRMRLAPFGDMQGDALRSYMVDRGPPVSDGETIHKARLWLALPLNIKLRTYDELKPFFEAECQYWRFDAAKAFPEPPGMEDYRREHPTRVQDEKKTDVETLPVK